MANSVEIESVGEGFLDKYPAYRKSTAEGKYMLVLHNALEDLLEDDIIFYAPIKLDDELVITLHVNCGDAYGGDSLLLPYEEVGSLYQSWRDETIFKWVRSQRTDK